MSFNTPQKSADSKPPVPQRTSSRSSLFPSNLPASPNSPLPTPPAPQTPSPPKLPPVPPVPPMSPELPPPPPPPTQPSTLNIFTPPPNHQYPVPLTTSTPSASHQSQPYSTQAYPALSFNHTPQSAQNLSRPPSTVQPQLQPQPTSTQPTATTTTTTANNGRVPTPSPPPQPPSSSQQTVFFDDDRESEDEPEQEYDATSFKLNAANNNNNNNNNNKRPTIAGNAPITISDTGFFNKPESVTTQSAQNNNQSSSSSGTTSGSTSAQALPIPPAVPHPPIEFEVANLGQIHAKKPYGTVGIRSELYPNSPDHSKILNLIRTRSMSLYNAVYKINKTFTNIPTPNPSIYHKLVSQSQMITERLDRFNDRKFQEKDSKFEQEKLQQQKEQQQQQAAQAIPISQALKSYPDILAACLDSPELANTIVMLLNSIYDLQRAHTFDFDTATTIEAAYAYHHQKLENLQQQEEESRRKAIALTKDYLSIKNKEDHKKVEKAAMMAYNAIRTYEHDRKESCFQIIHTDLASTGTIIKPLRVRLQSYYDYYKKGFKLMQPFEPLLQELNNRCTHDDDYVNGQLYQLSQEQDVLDRQVKQYLTKLNLLETANGISMTGQGSMTNSNNQVGGGFGAPVDAGANTGIRDLDSSRKVNRELGTSKRGFLYTPPPSACRVWVELKDKVLRVSEEVSTSMGSKPGGDSRASGFQNLLDKVKAEAQTSYGSATSGNSNSNQASSTGMNNSSSNMDSSSQSSSQISYKTIFETQTMLLTAKALRDSKYRYVFQVIGPTGNCTLQAESEVIMNEWLDVIQNAIGDDLKLDDKQQSSGNANPQANKLNHLQKRRSISATTQSAAHAAALQNVTGSSNTPYNPNEVLERLQQVPGNKNCCDCGAPNPDWISINLGILMCLDCSGAHRQLGVSISKVRSIMMDKLDPHIITYCCSLGNTVINNIFLEFHSHDLAQAQQVGGKLDPALTITTNSSRNEKFEHIRCKYQDKRWALQDILITSMSHRVLSMQQIEERHVRLTTLLYNGVRQDSISNVYRACISGADPTRCMTSESVAPLFESVLYNCPTFLTCMLQFTEHVNYREERGWNCLHYAAYVNSLEMCEIALAACGSELAVAIDSQGNTPRQVAEHFNSDEPEFQQDLPQLMALLANAELKYQQKMAKNY